MSKLLKSYPVIQKGEGNTVRVLLEEADWNSAQVDLEQGNQWNSCSQQSCFLKIFFFYSI